MRYILTLALAFTCSVTYGQGRLIDAPDEIDVGKLLVLRADDIPSISRIWVLVNPPPDYETEVSDDGNKMYFSTGHPGLYYFVLAYSPEKEPDAEPDLQAIKYQLLVVGDGKPNPNPNPDPNPKPDFDERYGLATLSRAAALKSVPDRSRAEDIAAAYNLIATRISAGVLKTETVIFKSTQEQLISKLGSSFDTWKPWGQSVMMSVSGLMESGDIKTDADIADAWREISVGVASAVTAKGKGATPDAKEE
jgi:hypothetical protein